MTPEALPTPNDCWTLVFLALGGFFWEPVSMCVGTPLSQGLKFRHGHRTRLTICAQAQWGQGAPWSWLSLKVFPWELWIFITRIRENNSSLILNWLKTTFVTSQCIFCDPHFMSHLGCPRMGECWSPKTGCFCYVWQSGLATPDVGVDTWCSFHHYYWIIYKSADSDWIGREQIFKGWCLAAHKEGIWVHGKSFGHISSVDKLAAIH